MSWTFDDTPPKPHVHPVLAPHGRVLTCESPPDHPWMRGLWFAIKFVNGVNCWEEAEQDHAVQVRAGDSIEWRSASGRVLLREYRELTPDGDALDWTTTLLADEPTVLDRTPFTTWGGYGGLAFRGAPDWEGTRILLDDGTVTDRPTGLRSRWADLSGPDAGIAVLDHPGNPRHPVPWYGGTRSPIYGPAWANFLNAALLFHEPLTIAAGEPLRLRYRVVVHDGCWDRVHADGAWANWVAAT